jgi:predicted benzoate:H+ symporter BenE
MKAIGAVAIGQGAAAGLTGSAVVGAGLVTGLVWLILGATGMAKRAADLVPRPALLGVILGLGFSFMLEGIRMMSGSPWLAWPLLALTLVMLSRSAVSRAPTKSTASSFSQPPRLPSGTSALPSSSAFSAITHRSADGSIPKLE